MSSSDDNKDARKQPGANPLLGRDQDEHYQPGIARPGHQPDQQQLIGAPPQPGSRQFSDSNRWIPPTTGNPDLDPAGQHGGQLDPLGGRSGANPLTPQGMLYDPVQLLDWQRRGQTQPESSGVPPGARFDPFGPPDPSQVGPGRGPLPSAHFGTPDPDHFQPPGQPQPPPLGKSLKYPWPPGRRGPGGFPPPGGAGGSPFL